VAILDRLDYTGESQSHMDDTAHTECRNIIDKGILGGLLNMALDCNSGPLRLFGSVQRDTNRYPVRPIYLCDVGRTGCVHVLPEEIHLLGGLLDEYSAKTVGGAIGVKWSLFGAGSCAIAALCVGMGRGLGAKSRDRKITTTQQQLSLVGN
jgi:hypothetical protein